MVKSIVLLDMEAGSKVLELFGVSHGKSSESTIRHYVLCVIKLYVLTRPRISGLLVFKIICAFLLKDGPIGCH